MESNVRPKLNPQALIESVDYEGRGIAHRDGKVVFIEGAITGETVTYSAYRKKESFELAQTVRIVRASAMRQTPRCPHAWDPASSIPKSTANPCGGCSMQHMEPRAQVAAKQRVLEDNLQRIGKVKPEAMLAPIHGPSFGYRLRARLSVRYVAKKGGVLVGFHERKSSFVADMRECHVLPPRLSALLAPLRELISGLSIREKLAQIEVAVGEHEGKPVDVLVLRVLEPPSAQDACQLDFFATLHHVQLWLQPKGPETAAPAFPLDQSTWTPLQYVLPEFGVTMPFKPTDFTQVNHQINAALVGRALRLLDAQPHERIADFFCGIGNFTLPIATQAREVFGVEGSQSMVDRALDNARSNGLAERTRFAAANLFETTPEQFAAWGRFDRLLIDPPREGAIALVSALPAWGDAAQPQRIVYVSCNPATLARDANVLVHIKGYVLKTAGVVNMFPQTSHVESIAVFERGETMPPPSP